MIFEKSLICSRKSISSLLQLKHIIYHRGSWSYGRWIFNNLWNQCLSPLTLWVRIPLTWGVLDTTLCDKVCQWLAAGRWFSAGASFSSTNKIDRHDITEILLKVALNTITLTLFNTVMALTDWLVVELSLLSTAL